MNPVINQMNPVTDDQVKPEMHSDPIYNDQMDPGTPEIKKAHPHTVSAAKVAEVLKAAGEAFCRLGECTMMLDNQSTPTKSKWMLNDVSELSQTVKKFREDLGTISATMQKRTSQKLKENLQKHFSQSSGQKQRTQIGQSQRPQIQRPIASGNPHKREVAISQSPIDMKRSRLQEVPRQGQHTGQTVQVQQSRPIYKTHSQPVMRNPISTSQPSNNQRSPGQQITVHRQNSVSGNVTKVHPQNQQTQFSFSTQPSQGQRLVGTTIQGQMTGSLSNQNQQVGSHPSCSSHGQPIQRQVRQVVQVNPRVQSVQGSTQMVIGDGHPNTPKYTVQQTIIDGKKTLILDHQDLARLLQSNNGSGTAVVLQPQTVSENNGTQSQSQGQTLMVMPTQQNGSQNR